MLRTPHFDVIFEKKMEEVARVFAQAAETAHATLVGDFSEAPRRTVLVVADIVDEANGLATVFPYPMILVYPVLPQFQSSIADYGDWALELMLHEYAHILNMHPVRGFYRPLSWLFGSLVQPNALLPRWYQEGLAVEIETRYSQHGRLRSTRGEAVLRALVKEELLERESLPWINETSIDLWPYGARPYLFGSYLWREMIERGGESLIDDLNQVYARRVPFWPSPPLKRRLGVDYSELWSETRQNLQDRARQQLKVIAPSTSAEPLGLAGLGQRSLRLHPDSQRLLYVASRRGSPQSQIRLSQREEGQEHFSSNSQVLLWAPGVTSAVWVGEGNQIVFDRVAENQIHQSFRDLYIHNLDKKTTRRLTHGERATQPAVSPSGRWLAYVSQGPLQTRLMLRDLEAEGSQRSRGVIPGSLGVRISQPEFLSESELLVVMRAPEGDEGLYLIDLEKRQRRRVLSSFSSLSAPRKSPLGVLVTSRHSGVSNIYLANREMTDVRPLTNVDTEVQEAQWDPVGQSLYASYLTAKGPQVARMALDPSQGVSPPQILPLVEVPRSSLTVKEKPINPSGTYRPGRYLWPRYLLPFVYPVEGGVLVQGTTSAADPLNRQEWELNISYDSISEQLSYALAYSHRATRVWLSAYRADVKEYLPSSQTVLTRETNRLSASFYPPLLSTNWRSSLSLLQSSTQSLSGVDLERQGLGVVLSYGDRLSADRQVFQVQHQHFLQGEGLRSYDRTEVSYALSWVRGLPERHNLHPQLRASWAPGLADSDLLLLGDRTINGKYLASLLSTQFMMRGYPSAGFLGRSMANLNLEYNFPLLELNRGYGLMPFFGRNIQGRIFVDAVALEGFYFDAQELAYRRTSFSQQFYSSGAELILNSTVAYHMPMSLTLGIYYGFDQKAGGGLMPFLTMAIGGIPGLSGQ